MYAIRSYYARGAFVLGPIVEAFEKEFAEALGLPHVVGVNSGTDALVIALDWVRAARGAGEVITTPFTFVATAEVIAHTGAKPVFADIDLV